MPKLNRYLLRIAWLALAGWTLLPAAARTEEVMVAVAANFAPPMRKIAAEFEQASGHRVVIVLGSTGGLHAQIRNGAPFQLLLAADQKTPLQLENEGLGVRGTRTTYAIGRLALWSPAAARVDAEGQVLRESSLGRLVIANPKTAPYGAAALQVMERSKVPDSVRGRLVFAESVGQAYQLVASGAAPLGFVALSQVMQDGRLEKGSAWVVPEGLHDPIRQDLVLLKPGLAREGARALHAYILGPQAQAIIRAHGYTR